MSIEIDPKEVIEHLKEYGIERISEERLKCFIKDLKKLIKHDEKKRKTEWHCVHYSTQEEYTPNMQWVQNGTKGNNVERKEKTEECICQSCCEYKFRLNNNTIRTRRETPDLNFNCNIMTDSNHVSSTHCNCYKFECIKPTTIRNCMSSKHTTYCSNHEFVRPATAQSSTHLDFSKSEFVRPTTHNCIRSVNCNSSKSECTIPVREPPTHLLPTHCNNSCHNHECVRPATTQCCFAAPHASCFNQEDNSADLKENTRPTSSVEVGEAHLKNKTQKKLINDPVLLYHKYQSVWKKHKLPGENDHALLRRAIREKMKYKP